LREAIITATVDKDNVTQDKGTAQQKVEDVGNK
jgi:hypothetical protein